MQVAMEMSHYAAANARAEAESLATNPPSSLPICRPIQSLAGLFRRIR